MSKKQHRRYLRVLKNKNWRRRKQQIDQSAKPVETADATPWSGLEMLEPRVLLSSSIIPLEPIVAAQAQVAAVSEIAGTSVNFNDFTIQSYGGSQDFSPATTVEDNGDTLHIVGNGWKKIALSYNVTADTILEFDFASNARGDAYSARRTLQSPQVY